MSGTGSDPLRRCAGCLITINLLLMLGACGFHLRGSTDLPSALRTTYIHVPGSDTRLANELERLLTASGARVTTDRQEASAVLEVLRDNFSRRTLSVGSRGKVREFELHYAVEFAVRLHRGKRQGSEMLVPPQTVSLVRDFTFDETEVLGASNEEDLLRQNMQRDIAVLMLYRIEAQAR
jgi:Rare lipoprotein B